MNRREPHLNIFKYGANAMLPPARAFENLFLAIYFRSNRLQAHSFNIKEIKNIFHQTEAYKIKRRYNFIILRAISYKF